MKIKRNYTLIVGLILFFLAIGFIIIFLKPVEYFNEKIVREMVKSGEDYIPESLIPKNYFSLNQYQTDVQKYIIDISFDDEMKSIIGKVKIYGRLKSKMSTIDLNFYDNMKINNLLLNGKKADYTHDETKLSVETRGSGRKFSLEIEYSGKPHSLYFGSFNITMYEDSPVVYTINEPIFASTWLPCNDLPNDKAMYEIFITADPELTSLSNGKLVDIKIAEDKKISHWKTVYPMSTYLLAINIGNYKVITDECVIGDKKIPLSYYIFPENLSTAKQAFEKHPEYIEFFSNLIGDYPFADEKYSIVEILWKSGAIENQSIIGIGSPFIDSDKEYENLYVHELAHQWFGNSVSPESWEDVWLAEGFATYCEALYLESKDNEQAMSEYMKDKFDYFEKSTLYNPGIDLFSNVVYDKGAWTLHMLRDELGDEKFFEILKRYYNAYKYKNASTFDFKKICEKVSGKKLDKFFDQWVISGKGIPEIEYEIVSKKDNVYLWLNQIQTGYEIYEYPIDVVFTTGEESRVEKYYISTQDTLINLNMKEIPSEIEFDPDTKLLAEFLPAQKNE